MGRIVTLGFLLSALASGAACKSEGYEAFCYGTAGAAVDGDGDGATKVYLCYQARSTCEKLQAKKAKIAEGQPNLGFQVGPCEKTTTMFCATPTADGEQLVCGPSQATCDSVVAAARASGRLASECKKMSRAELDGLRTSEESRRKSQP